MVNIDVLAQNATIYGNTQVVSGQTYTYEASVNATKYIWSIRGGNIIGNPPHGKVVQVIWDNETSGCYINYATGNGQIIELPVRVVQPVSSCFSYYPRYELEGLYVGYSNNCPYRVCVDITYTFPNDPHTYPSSFTVEAFESLKKRSYVRTTVPNTYMNSYTITSVYRCD